MNTFKFPEYRYSDSGTFVLNYIGEQRRVLAELDPYPIASAAQLIEDRIKKDHTIFVCGNGGSAAIANHLECDFAKGIPTGTDSVVVLRPKIVSLCRLEILTAYANDYTYEDVFWRQLERASRPGDLLIAMSVSGNSQNVIQAVSRFSPSVIITGFDGGALDRMGVLDDIRIHVNSYNYGICEDVFQSIMHIIAQYIRQSNMPENAVKHTKF